MLSWTIEIWMKKHVVSDSNQNIVNLDCLMLGLHLVLVTLHHGSESVTINIMFSVLSLEQGLITQN
jgi:hypothetical protein